MRIAALSLVYSRAECCALVCFRIVHTCLIDSVFNDALRLVTGCLCLTPTNSLLTLVSVQPAKLRRQGATLLLANRRILNPKHLLNVHLVRPLEAWQERLKSRPPFVPGERKLFDNAFELDIRVGQCIGFTWNMEYLNSPYKLCNFIPRVDSKPLELGLVG